MATRAKKLAAQLQQAAHIATASVVGLLPFRGTAYG